MSMCKRSNLFLPDLKAFFYQLEKSDKVILIKFK